MVKTVLGALSVVAAIAPNDKVAFDAEDALQRSYAAYAAGVTAYSRQRTRSSSRTSELRATEYRHVRTYFEPRQPPKCCSRWHCSMIESEYNDELQDQRVERDGDLDGEPGSSRPTTSEDSGARDLPGGGQAARSTPSRAPATAPRASPGWYPRCSTPGRPGWRASSRRRTEATAAGTENVRSVSPCHQGHGHRTSASYPSGQRKQPVSAKCTAIWCATPSGDTSCRRLFQRHPKEHGGRRDRAPHHHVRPYGRTRRSGPPRFRYAVPE